MLEILRLWAQDLGFKVWVVGFRISEYSVRMGFRFWGNG